MCKGLGVIGKRLEVTDFKEWVRGSWVCFVYEWGYGF